MVNETKLIIEENIKDIRNYISKKEYQKALDLIEKCIKSNSTDKKDESWETFYSDLISLRIAAKTMTGKKDEILLHLQRESKEPYRKDIEIAEKRVIHLIDQNVFLFKCDAWVNAYHATKSFDYSKMSFSYILQESVGKETIEKQIKNNKGTLTKNNFFILEHSNLKAPRSYNIPAYINDNEVNSNDLRKGLLSVLDDIKDKNLKTVGFAAMGMSGNLNQEEKEYTAKMIAETISDYFKSIKDADFAEIYFPFLTFKSFQIFEKAFESITPIGKYIEAKKENLIERQKKLIEEVHTKDKYFQEILEKIGYSLDEKLSILLLGESGVGKSHIAEIIHNLSNRNHRKFSTLNCATVSHENMFSALFGFRKGAFTNVVEGGESIFEVSEGGTVFLDEIGYAHIDVQQSLLTFLDKGIYKKLGDQTEYHSNVRIIFGTNQNLENMVNLGLFIHDLYERISSQRVFTIPPIRDRKDDFEIFIRWRISELNKEFNFNIEIETEAINHLTQFEWPGNIRQLKFYIEKAFFDVTHLDKPIISYEMIKNSPPRNYQLKGENNLSNLENILSFYLNNWDPIKYGKFRNDFIEPIIAKIFIEDLEYNKTDSNKILGMDSSHKESYFDLAYKKYLEIRNNFK